MKNRPTLIDDNVEEIRRVRREASRRFKSFDEMWLDALSFEKKFQASKKPGRIDGIIAAVETELRSVPAGRDGKPVLIDDNVEECRRVRREIFSRYKTMDDYFDHLQELERARMELHKQGLAAGPYKLPQKRKGTAKVKKSGSKDAREPNHSMAARSIKSTK